MTSASRMASDGTGTLLTHGVREAEKRLFDELRRLEETGRGDLGILERPIRIIVPSRSLRAHLCEALVRTKGRPLLGVAVHTLNGAARLIANAPANDTTINAACGEALFPVLCRREAASLPALRQALDELEDGYASVVGTVADLLDAGLTSALVPALDELLAERIEQHGSSAALLRARELMAVAVRVLDSLRNCTTGRANDLLRRAGEYFAQVPEQAFPARAILIYGFADVTGLAGDFLQQLVRTGGARVFVDLPPDSPGAEATDVSAHFVQPLLDRLPTAAVEACGSYEVAAPDLKSFVAPAAEDEFDELARRIRALLVQDVRPEAIGVVLRELSPDAPMLAAVLRGEGIPFSAVVQLGESAFAGRFLGALRALLRAREQIEIELWLDLLQTLLHRGESLRLDDDLRARLRVLLCAGGRSCLRDLVRFESRSGVAADLRSASHHGSSLGYQREERDGSVLWNRRRVGVDEGFFEAVVETGRVVLSYVEGWPASGHWRAHLAYFQKILRKGLGWEAEVEGLCGRILNECECWERLFPESLMLTKAEAAFLLDQLLGDFDSSLRPTFGGAGAGIQVLSAMEARGRSFEHLFLVGLNRDVFPRAVREDPLLLDWIRRLLAQLLPDLSPKQRGLEEERYLFAQLLTSAPEVTLSWREQQEDGKEVAPSSLVARLEIEGLLADAARVPPRDDRVWFAEADAFSGISAERALRFAGLYGSREQVGKFLPVALREQSRAAGLCAEEELAQIAVGRSEVLAEIDPDLRTKKGRAVRETPGPYLGFVGSVTDEDPRRNPLYVTSLENLARCPWQMLLERLLGLALPPGSDTALDALDGKLRGEIVHAVLERIARRVLDPARGMERPKSLAALRGCAPVALPWPSEEELQAILHAVAEQKAAELGIPGCEGLLVAQCLPYLERARELDWSGGAKSVACLAVEIEGQLVFATGSGSLWPLRFRVDRADYLSDDGALLLVDYKTGRNFVTGVKEETRRKQLLAAIRSGKNLQGAAYALASAGGQGRYLFLNPVDSPDRADVQIAADDEVEIALSESVSVAWQGMEAGYYFPRLFDAKRNTPKPCKYCEVREACRLGDSGFRMRLEKIVEAQTGLPEAFRALWNLADLKQTDSACLSLLHLRREDPA